MTHLAFYLILVSITALTVGAIVNFALTYLLNRSKSRNKPRFHVGQRIRLLNSTLFYLGGINEFGNAWIETHHILEFFKEADKHYYFNLICNSEKGDRLQNGDLVFIDKSIFNDINYKQ